MGAVLGVMFVVLLLAICFVILPYVVLKAIFTVFYVSLLFVNYGTTSIHVYCGNYLDSVDLFHIATMFSYPKLVWRIRLTQDLSVRVSLLETIVGVWVWLLCL
jgi:hypothetical protein